VPWQLHSVKRHEGPVGSLLVIQGGSREAKLATAGADGVSSDDHMIMHMIMTGMVVRLVIWA
jgi:hypothetical protein